MNSRKGVLDIEFMLSIFIFLTVLSFVTLTVINNIPKLHQEVLSQDLKNKAYQVSEMLILDEGSPKNWSGGIDNVKRIGLASGKKYLINNSKIQTLQSYCSNNQANYEKIKYKLGLDFRNDVSIEMTDYVNKIDCKPPVISTRRTKAVITRIGVDDTTKRLWIITVAIS